MVSWGCSVIIALYLSEIYFSSGTKISGKPYEGKPHVRFDEGLQKTAHRGKASASYSTACKEGNKIIFWILLP